jgi:hypothetical protein
MIEYYIDGSTKENMIGVGIVRVNEFGFIEKHHFKVEHINSNSTIAEGYSLEKTFEMIEKNDINKNETIDIYTDCQKLYHSLLFNGNTEFNRSNFFAKQESNHYLLYIRNLYIDLISRHSNYPIYHCSKTKQARPLIKVFFKDDVKDKKFLQEAHSLSRNYIKEEKGNPIKIELKAIRKNEKWHIVKDNKEVVAENKRPLLALSEALKQIDTHTNEIKLCEKLKTILKSTDKNRLTSDDMKSAVKVIENHKLLINF